MNLLLSSTIKSASPENKSKIIFIYAVSLVGCVVLFLYGLINILVEDYPAAYFELFLSISLLLCIFIIRGSKNTRIAENIGSSVAFVIAFHNFYSGGFGETGLFWVYLFPAIIFFVKGKKNGLRWLFIFYTLLVLIVFIHVYLPNTDILPYQNLTIITFLVSFITISFFIYFYQSTQENTQKLLTSKKTTLEHANEDLQSLIIKRKRTESQMSKILGQLTDQNYELEKNKRAMLSLLQDIDEEKEKNKLDKDRLARILESIADGVLVLNKKKQIVVTNNSLSTLSGFSNFEITGKTYKEVFEFFSDDEGNDECRFIDDVFSIHKQKETSNKATFKSKSGDLIPVFATASPLFSNDGMLTGAVVVVRDIRKEREVDKMKTEFVSVASHQLKTPLTGAMWTLELLENEETGPLNEKQKQLINELAETHKGMSDLVTELLNVSRIDRGEKFDILKTREDINSIVKSSIIELRKISEMNNVEVDFSSSDEVINIDIDAKKIEEAVKNLISNAIKYSQRNSRVYVNVLKEIGNKKVVIEISDSGIGIPEAEQKHIFEKFYRASNAKANDISGTGLGLYIAKAVAEGHEGKLYFESKEGEGTKFIMEIPLT